MEEQYLILSCLKEDRTRLYRKLFTEDLTQHEYYITWEAFTRVNRKIRDLYSEV